MISIVLLTFNRIKLLKLCVEQVLAKTSDATSEIIIWNNASTDGTDAYLNALKDPRLKIINHTRNIGVNARAKAFALPKYDYLISLDDDVIDAPENWDKILMEAFDKLPDIGFMATNIIDDKKGTHAEYMFRKRNLNAAASKIVNGVEIIPGWGGNWCAITCRHLYEKVGGFQENANFIYWNEDNEYTNKLEKIGYGKCLLKDLKVFHAAGPYYVNDKNIQEAKKKFFGYLHKKNKSRKRKAKIKNILDKIPPIRYLNERFKFYRHH